MDMPDLPEAALDGLVDSVTLLLTQIRLGDTLPTMQNTVRDVRHRIAQLLHDYVAICDDEASSLLEQTLQNRFRQSKLVCADLAAVSDHIDYCIREVMVCFEIARQVCAQHPSVETRQHLLDDLPILRPFDYPTATKEIAA